MARSFEWFGPPPDWRGDATALEIVTGRETDFWRETFYGFVHDDGHAWLTEVDGDFTAVVRFSAEYATLYDQAGLLLRRDERTWVKAGVEFTDGGMHFSVVVTNGKSDWSQLPLVGVGPQDAVSVRLTRHGDAIRVQYAIPGAPWRMARLAPFPAGPARIGPMACSPLREGLRARFADFELGPPIPRDLHAD